MKKEETLELVSDEKKDEPIPEKNEVDQEKVQKDKRVYSVVSFAMGLSAYLISGPLLMTLIFSIVGLVFGGKARNVELTRYRVFKTTGQVLSGVCLAKVIISIIISILTRVLVMLIYMLIALIYIIVVFIVATSGGSF